MSLVELKAKAYDLIAALEALQKELQGVNQLISEKLQQQNADGSSDNYSN